MGFEVETKESNYKDDLTGTFDRNMYRVGLKLPNSRKSRSEIADIQLAPRTRRS